MMKTLRNCLTLLVLLVLGISLTGCSATDGKRIIRISHGQSESHPEHIGLLAFEQIIEDKLGDRFEVEIYPNELLGAAQKAIELCQTGAIDFVVAGTANLETFADVYEVFSMPYLFTSEEAYHDAMNDREYMETVYVSTRDSGFQVLTWYNAGTRSFYASKPIYTPEDLKGLKIRVQQSPASVNMVNSFGAAATPLSFGEVYTAIQQGVIDGAENNELALTNNKHGEVAKYYSYNRHQMVPDMLIASTKFLDSLTEEEYEIVLEAALESTAVELEAWDASVEDAIDYAKNTQGVEFIDVDVQVFKDAVSNVQGDMLAANEHIQDLYEHIQIYNKKYENQASDTSGSAGSDSSAAAATDSTDDAANGENK